MISDNRHQVIDADGHVIERDQELFEFLPPPFRGYGRVLAYPFFPTLDGFHRAARKAADGTRVTSLEIPTAEHWLSFLDEANLAATVLFPTAGLAFGLVADPDWAAGLARAYNDWLHDRFLKHNRVRLKGVALIPLQDPSRAVGELEHAIGDLGMVGAVLPAAGLREAFGHRSFWPVYEAAQELDCLLAVHGAPAYGLGLERLHKMIEVRTLTHPFSQFLQMTSMMFGGVFDAFPRLKVAFCEAGSGWAPYLLERLDMEYWNRRPQVPEVKAPPSEHLRSGRIFIHTELGEAGLANAIRVLGEEPFFCASDYPHEPKDEFPEALEEFAEREDIPESAKRKIRWDNPIRMYGLDEATLTASARSSQAVG
ncbi:MAG TPA: amidohydrolase family protein [Chloroflexota bacterium]|nr:amidohydrolase family protein [Chloroflexota bacterium]